MGCEGIRGRMGARAGGKSYPHLSDPVEALLRCGPIAPRHTIVAGRALVADGRLTADGVEQMLRRHRGIAAEWLAAAGSGR